MIFRGSIPHPMQSLCTLRNRCHQRSRNTRYQADATPYLGRTSTGWIAPACGWRTYSITSSARPSMVGEWWCRLPLRSWGWWQARIWSAAQSAGRRVRRLSRCDRRNSRPVRTFPSAAARTITGRLRLGSISHAANARPADAPDRRQRRARWPGWSSRQTTARPEHMAGRWAPRPS